LPQHNRLISESEKKCDAEDVRVLTELLYMNRLKAVHHSPWAFRQLREGVRAYYTASRDLTRAKSRLKAFYLFNGIHCQGDTVYSSRSRAAYIQQIKKRSGNLHLLNELYRRLDFFRDSKAEHIKTLRELGPLLPDGQQVLRRLMTYPGIGFIGACTVAAYVEDGRRLSNKRRLWQYCGLGIRRHESAGTGRQGASRQGNRYLKNVFMTAAAAIAANRNGDNALSRKWIADVGSGQHPARVKRNLARKLAVLTQRSLRTKEEYNDERVRTP
jgi:transposase